MSRVLKLTEIFNDTVEKIASSKLVTTTLSNPFITALLLTITLVLIMAFVFRHEVFLYEEASKYYVKIGFIVFIISSFLLFFQNFLLIRETDAKIGSNEYANIFDIGGTLDDESSILNFDSPI